MSHVKDILLDQFLENVNDPSWYRPFTESVEGLIEEEAFWKPNEDCHSIAEIVQHLIYWNETWQTRFDKSEVKAVPSIENDKSFIISENQTFDNLRDRLIEILLKWQDILTEESVENDVKGFPVTAKWWELLGNATTHNAYHIGQIIYIRKLQKSWNRKK
ncbi:DinB family protein [Virgibacillus litoralis]|uniref:Damage-inducible protein DinB n=1 Tax=Virgibacillus litoralis TaxID=578221 RepID=A0ABS4HGF7_9BACI|nr:DinB family protein [Virgibacillus litoralis]MBP1949913.1 putative damage-inducible protein DinB [Virgibacillus litoralis]